MDLERGVSQEFEMALHYKKHSKIRIFGTLAKMAEKDPDDSIRVKKSQILYHDLSVTLVRPQRTVLSCREQLQHSVDAHLRYLYDTQKLCDLTITNREKKFGLHRIVLAAQSPKYKTVFADESSPPPSEITVTDVSTEVLEKVVRYLYTGEITLTEGNVAEVTDVCFQLDIRALLEDSRQLLSKFNTTNAVKYLVLAHRHHFDDLERQLIAFAQQNFAQIGQLHDFLKLDAEVVCAILKGDEAREAGEVELLRAAMAWLDAEPQARREKAAEVLGCLRLEDVSPQRLVELLEKNSTVADIPEVSLMLYKAYKHQALQPQHDNPASR